jgi:hypothetical protein
VFNAKVGKVLELHTNKDASEAPTLPHTLVGKKINNTYQLEDKNAVI